MLAGNTQTKVSVILYYFTEYMSDGKYHRKQASFLKDKTRQQRERNTDLHFQIDVTLAPFLKKPLVQKFSTKHIKKASKKDKRSPSDMFGRRMRIGSKPMVITVAA